MKTNQRLGGIIFGFIGLATLWFFATSTPSIAQVSLVDKTLISSASTNHPVEIFSVNQPASSIVEAFAHVNKPYYPEDQISYFPDPTLGLGTIITVQRALSVNVLDGKRTKVIRTWVDTVGAALEEKGILLGAEDRIAPALSTTLSSNTTVIITRVARTTVTEKEVVKFDTKIEKDYSQFVGPQTVIEAGKNGEREKIYLVIREDGELVSKTLQTNKITIPPRTALIRQGGLNSVPKQCVAYKDWVVNASSRNKIDPNQLYYRMIRESNCHPNSSGAGGKYNGLFQYEIGLWNSVSAKAGYPGASVWDAKSQIDITAWSWAHGYRGRWPNP